MAFRYLIYSTGTTFATTIVRESATNNPGANEASFYTDFIIPEIQPLYLWRVDNATTPTTVIPNTDANISAYLQSVAPPPSYDDYVIYGQLTGITENKIDTVTGATNQVPIFTSDGNLLGSGYTIDQLTGGTGGGVPYDVFTGYTASTDQWLEAIDEDLLYISGVTDNKIDKVTGATDNIAIFDVNGNLLDGGYTIPELTGLTTYTFIASGGTHITQVGNTVTISSTVPTGTTVNWGDIAGTISNQTDLWNILTGITGETETKLDISTFTGYTATTQPVIDAALTGITNLGTGTTLGGISGRNITLKSISVVGGLSLLGDADNLIISGETNAAAVWGNITGTLSDQTDLWGELTGKTDNSVFVTYTGNTENVLDLLADDIDYISGVTDTKLNIVSFTGYSATTETRFEGIEADIQYLSGITSGITAELDGKLDVVVFTGYTASTETRISDLEDDSALWYAERGNYITGATNGISKTDGHNIILGGALTQDTVISGTTYDFTVNVDNITLQSTGAVNIVDANGVGGINIETDGGTISLIGNDSLGVEKTKIEISDTQMLVTDSRTTPIGIIYAGDYSASFTNESLVTKRYVDSIATGLIPKAAVKAVTTTSDGNIDLTGGTFAGTIDGYTLLDGDRVLITEQTLATENGIYVYTLATNDFARSSDFDGNPGGEVVDGNLIPVITGNTLYNTIWVLVTPNPIIVDTTPLTFTLFSSPHELIAGLGISITGNTISVNGSVLAGNSIVWTGNTFNVDITTGTLATALNSKLDVTAFNSYTGTTETRLIGIEDDVDYISGVTDTKLDITTFTGYTAATGTILSGIEDDVDYISGVTDSNFAIFTGYTASTTPNEIFLIHTGGTDVNTIAATDIIWNSVVVSGSSYSWTGGSDIYVLEAGSYELSYNIPYSSQETRKNIGVAANIILNNNTILDNTSAGALSLDANSTVNIALPTVILSLNANDKLTLAAFRTAAAGVSVTEPNGSILIKKKNKLQ